jgi:hypothetical protein
MTADGEVAASMLIPTRLIARAQIAVAIPLLLFAAIGVLLPLIGMVALNAPTVPMFILQDLPLVPAILATLLLL